MFRFLNWSRKKDDYEELDDDDGYSTRLKNIFGPNSPITYFSLYRYATSIDFIYSILAIISTWIVAICQLNYAILFAKSCGYFITYTEEISNSTITTAEYNTQGKILQHEILNFALILTIFAAISFIFQCVAEVLWTHTSIKQIKQHRQQFLEKILNQDISWFDVHRSENFVSEFTYDLNNIEEALSEKVIAFIYHVVVFLMGILMSAYIGWKLTLVCLISLPTTLIAGFLIMKITEKCTKNKVESYASAQEVVEEVFSAIKTVVAYNGQSKEIERYKHNLREVKSNNIKRNIFDSLKEGFLFFFMYSCCGLSTWYGIQMMVEGNAEKYTAEDMIAIIYLTWVSCWNFYMILPYFQLFKAASESAKNLYKITDSHPRMNIAIRYGLRPIKCLGQITFNKIHFNYPSHPSISILNGFSLIIQPGETIGLVGTPGCNSTACFQLLQRFYDPTYGKILIDGGNIKDLNLIWWRKQVGMVEQAPKLLKGSILENIRHGKMDANMIEVEKAAKAACIHNFIKKLPNGYNEKIDKNQKLSREHKWKIALARAVIRKPTILLIDTTSIVEKIGEREMKIILDEVTKNTTSIVIANNLSTVKHAKRICIFSEGHIEHEGSYKDLLNNPRVFYSFQGAQSQTKALDTVGGAGSMTKTKIQGNTELISGNEDESINLKDIIKLNSPEYPWIIIGAIFSFIFGASIPLSSILMTDIIATLYIKDSDKLFRMTDPICWKFLTLGIVSGTAYLIQNFSFGVAAEKLNFRLRSKLFLHFMEQEMSWFDEKENTISCISSKLSTDVALASESLGLSIGLIFNSLSAFLSSKLIAFYLHFQLAVILAVFIPIIFFSSLFEYQIFLTNTKTKMETHGNCNSIIEEVMNKISTIVSLGCEKQFLRRYTKDIELLYKNLRMKYYLKSLCTAVQRSFIGFTYACGFFYGVGLIINEDVEYSRVIKVCELQISSSWAIVQIFAHRQNISKGMKAARNIIKILRKSSSFNGTNGTEIPIKTGIINFCNVNFVSTKRQESILKEINLNIPFGKSVALVSSKDCYEKNWIIDLLQKFYKATNGNITIDDVDINSMDSKHLRSYFGIITRVPCLFNCTIAENIAYGSNRNEVSMEDILTASKDANIHEFIMSLPLGYDTRLGFKGCLLSMSQKQRLAIARALIRNPKILLIEDPLSMINHECLELVQDALDKARRNRTCIIITEDLTTIQDADLICFLHAGKIVEMGNHQALSKKEGYYNKLYKAQIFF